MRQPLLFVILILATVCFLVAAAHCQLNPLPLGTVTDNGAASCQGFQAHASCESLTISCPNADPLNVTVATVLGILGKTVLFANGSMGTLIGGNAYLAPLAKLGYTTVNFAWASPGWQSGPGNMMTAACRTSTLFSYVANGGQIALIAASGGAGAAGYALAWYGGDSFISGLWMTSGPVYSDLSQGCETPKANWVTVTPTNGSPWTSALNYNVGVPILMTTFTGQTCEPKSDTSQTEETNWLDQSILAPGAQLFYSTYLYVQLCSNAPQPNNSSGQAYLWLSQVTSPWSLTAISGCSGSEGTATGFTPQGETGADALLGDLEAQW
jgi:hypothetical protein